MNALFFPIRNRFRNIPTLSTERLILRKILPSDRDDMFEYSRDPRTSRYLLWEPHPNAQFTACHLADLQRLYAKAQFFDWAIVEKASGKMIGTVGFTQIYERKKYAEVGYVLSPAFQRRAIAPEALGAILCYGFETLGFNFVIARFMEPNEPSRKVLEKFGFQEDKSKRDSVIKRGKRERIITFFLTKNIYQDQNK